MKGITIFIVLLALLFSFASAEDIAIDKNTPLDIQRFIKVAQEELGYKEAKDGTTKYGIWAKDPQAQWCAEFICWSINKTDEKFNSHLLNRVYPNYSGQNVGRDWFISKGRYINRSGILPDWGYQWLRSTASRIEKNSYIPKSGDLVFFSYDGSFNTDHVALVEYVSYEDKPMIHVIEGNNPSSVARNVYPIDKSQILGYGTYSNDIITTMRIGNKGDNVKELKKMLSALSFLQEEQIDTNFDSVCYYALMQYQSSRGIDKNLGIADYATQIRLEKEYKKLVFYDKDSWLVSD